MQRLASQNPEYIFYGAFIQMTKKRVANIKQYSGTCVGNYNKDVFELSKDLCECSVLE